LCFLPSLLSLVSLLWKYTGEIRRGECHIPLAVDFDLESSFRKECGTAVLAVIGCVATLFSSYLGEVKIMSDCSENT